MNSRLILIIFLRKLVSEEKNYSLPCWCLWPSTINSYYNFEANANQVSEINMEKDSLVYGRIKEVYKYKLIICLPHNKTGHCKISDVSETYNNLLLEILDKKNSEIEIAELDNLFEKGQFVQVKVINSSKDKFEVTLLPSAVNSNININCLKAEMKVQAVIKSREDKGFILETGIPNINGFLPFSNCFGESYEIGKFVQVYPTLKKIEKMGKHNRVVNFTTDPKLQNQIIKSSPDWSYNSLHPGMLIKLTLQTALNGGLEGKFNGFSVTISNSHQGDVELDGCESTACILSLDPTTKHISGSLLPHLRPPFHGLDELLSVTIGHTDTACRLIKKFKSHMSLTMSSGPKYATVIVSKNHINPDLQKVVPGDTVLTRYTDYNLVDNTVVATTLPKLIAQSYFTLDQVRIGETVKGVVKKFSKFGVTVQISSKVSGIIPMTHLNEAKNQAVPNVMFKIGQTIRCRVFHVDTSSNRLVLTVRKSLLGSKRQILASFNDLQHDIVLDGFVGKILEHGLVVVLFNNIWGWVPINRIPESKQKSLTISYYKGQPVEVKVIRWNETAKKIELSLCLTDESCDANQEDSMGNLAKVAVGERYEATIQSVQTTGFMVRLQPINRIARLSALQLSDSREHQGLLYAHYSAIGSSRQKQNTFTVVVTQRSDKMITVSKKQSLIAAAISGTLLTESSNVTVSSQWLGWVTRKQPYGLFVELPSGVSGLVRNRDICDHRPHGIAPTDLFVLGDTVSARVLEEDPERPGKFLFTLRMSETYRAHEHLVTGSLDFVQRHLEERAFLQALPSCNKLHGLRIGQLVLVKLTKRCEWGFTLSVTRDATDINFQSEMVLSGFVRNQNLPEHPVSEGSEQRAVIIDIDLSEQMIELCLSGPLINAITNRNDTVTRLEPGQSVASDVLYVNHDLVVGALKGHAHGHLVFLSTRRFWNDRARQVSWLPNQRNKTVLKVIEPKVGVIGSLAINEPVDGDVKTINKTPGVAGAISTLPKRVKLVHLAKLPACFHSLTRHKLFFYLSQRQRGFCGLLEYSRNLEDIREIVSNPPVRGTLLPQSITVIRHRNKNTGLSVGHCLDKDSLEIGDIVCARVVSAYSVRKYRLILPFQCIGIVECPLTQNWRLRVHSIVQCQVLSVTGLGSKARYSVSLVGDKTVDHITNEDEVTEEDEVNEEDEENKEEDIESDGSVDEDEHDDIDQGETVNQEDVMDVVESDMKIPIICSSRKEKDSISLSSIYKRIHTEHNDDEHNQEIELSSLGDAADKKSEHPIAKKQKINPVNRELSIRSAEKRRETGETLKNPTNESEFELLVFNCPHDSSSWTRFMRYLRDTETDVMVGVDRARAVAERGMRTIPMRDAENRFQLMKEYIDMEIDELVKVTKNGGDCDPQLRRFRQLLERGLAQKARMFFQYVGDKLIEQELFELAEEIAKKFIKEFYYDPLSWFQLCLIRFVLKKYAVVRETLTNAERSLKAADFRDLQIRMAQVEIEKGDADRGVQQLIDIFSKKPKDGKLKQKITSILEKNELKQYVEKLESISTQ